MSANLGLDTVSPTQTGKTVTINDIFAEVDAAMTELLVVDCSGTSPFSITGTALARHWLFRLTGTVTSAVVNLPAVKRMFGVQNTGTHAAALTVGTTSISLAANATGMFYSDGTTNGLIQLGGGGGGGSSTLAGLSDVTITGTPTTGYVLTYNGTSWVPAAASGGGSTIRGSHKYWRLRKINCSSFPNISAAEIIFHATPGGSLEAVTTATASSNYDGSTVAANAVDGNTATLWATAASDTYGPWFQAYFSTAVPVEEIVITARNDSYYGQTPTEFELWYSDDGLVYTLAGLFMSTAYTAAGQSKTFAIGA